MWRGGSAPRFRPLIHISPSHPGTQWVARARRVRAVCVLCVYQADESTSNAPAPVCSTPPSDDTASAGAPWSSAPSGARGPPGSPSPQLAMAARAARAGARGCSRYDSELGQLGAASSGAAACSPRGCLLPTPTGPRAACCPTATLFTLLTSPPGPCLCAPPPTWLRIASRRPHCEARSFVSRKACAAMQGCRLGAWGCRLGAQGRPLGLRTRPLLGSLRLRPLRLRRALTPTLTLTLTLPLPLAAPASQSQAPSPSCASSCRCRLPAQPCVGCGLGLGLGLGFHRPSEQLPTALLRAHLVHSLHIDADAGKTDPARA
jgi:hypothetical protein